MQRRIAVVTTSRADWSHLVWVVREMRDHPLLAPSVVAIGAQLASEFGRAEREIVRDGLTVDERVECLLSSDTDVGMAKTIGVATLGLADTLGRMRPDLLLLVADRYELLAPAAVALALRIPIAHVEGGEVSEGAIDDAVRNALTKLSHVHFTPTESARRRVLALGEEPWRVQRVGAPSLDHLTRSRLLERAALERALGMSLDRPPLVVSYHPVTIARDTVREADAVFAALERVAEPLAFCFPNADAGSRELVRRAETLVATRPGSRLFVNLNPVEYWSLLGHAAALVGNSSSGIMETPSIPLPSVNVGLRQYGRERAASVVDAPADREAIVVALSRALDPAFRESLRGLANPYGDGQAAPRIARVLAELPLGEALLRKRARPVEGGPA
jgi:UDP-hydrolysing UDP-N-acetyl-D-glucosamine 2-epimerase